MTPHSFYLAGPMTGIPQFNFPAFDSAAAELRDQGYEIVSPAESHTAGTRALCLASPDGDLMALEDATEEEFDSSYGQFMARDIQIIIDDVDGIVVLHGWPKSRGARIEVFTAVTMGKPVYSYDPELTSIRELPLDVLEELLKPGDPGTNGHKTPAEAVGPPFVSPDGLKAIIENQQREPIYAAILRKRVEGKFLKAIVLRMPERGEKGMPTSLYGLPVILNPDLPEGSFKLVTEAASEHVPAGEERITDPDTGGQKGRKAARMELLPYEPLMKVAELYAFGASKYADNNWRQGFAWSLSAGALARHFALWMEGEDDDEETECNHLTSVVFHALALLYFTEHFPEKDDRPNTNREETA